MTQSTPTSQGTVTGTGSSIGEAAALEADLPCDVASVLSSACTTCHGEVPEKGAVNRLMTHAELSGPSRFDASLTEAQRCLTRMVSSAKPMPPSPHALPSEAQITILRKWIDGGYPKPTSKLGGCLPTPTPIDFSVEARCTTKKQWTLRDRGDEEMHPGTACNECHKREQARGEREAEIYSAAGTVFASAHEPDDCYGAGSVKVVLVDSTGAKQTTTTNKAGNFMFTKPLKGPYRAKLVLSDGTEIPMISEQTEGDCNTCHTADGKNDARGRIALP